MFSLCDGVIALLAWAMRILFRICLMGENLLGRVNMNNFVLLEKYLHTLEKQMRVEVLSSYLLRSVVSK